MPNFLDTVRQALAQKQAQQRPQKGQDTPAQGQPATRSPVGGRPQIRRGAARGG